MTPHQSPAAAFPAGSSAGALAPLHAGAPVAFTAQSIIQRFPALALEIHAQIEAANRRRRAPRNHHAGLTAKQKELLDFIRACYAMSGITPSFDEMKEAVGLASKSGVHRLVKALEHRGYIRRLPNRARALVPVEA